MKAMLCGSLCGCRRRLEADDDEELLHSVLAHLRDNHHVAPRKEEGRARKTVAAHAYRLEYAAPYAGGEGPDEEFGPEPY